MRTFTAEDIQRIEMTTAVSLMREAFAMLSSGQVVVPLRTVQETQDQKGMALFMPSYSPAWKLFGLKMVTVFPNNVPPAPMIQGVMLLMDAEHGTPLASMDAAAITALRTGAASGLASALLSRAESKTLALFGTGAQAWTQVAGVLAVRKIQEVMVKGTSTEKEESFCRRVRDEHKISCRPLRDLSELSHADIICTATGSHQPLFKLSQLKGGVHINAIGAYKPHMRELGEDIIARCKLMVDQRAAVLHEAGEVVIPMKEGRLTPSVIYAELGEIVAGKPGRASSDEITVFKSVGNAIQDLAVARFLINRVA